jgi:uncharacterized RDD family membrane protein YckC
MTSAATKQVDSRVVVETPEGVDFAFRIAGPGVRLSAWAIDLFIWLIFSAFLYLLFPWLGYLIGGQQFVQMSAGLLTIVSFLLSWFYGSLYEGLFNGQTPGKKHIGLRVVRTNGTPVDLLSAIGRNFLRIADFLPGTWTVALICMLSTRRLQRLGDLCFDTMVIQESRAPGGRSAGITAGVEPLARSECTRRFHVPDRTIAIIERLFNSDRIISDARREELAKPLSLAIRKRLGWRPPAPDPLNPHPFFQNRASEHTRFLRQVLKTFAVDDSLAAPQSAQRATATAAAAAISSAISRTASKAQSPQT